MPKRFDLQIVPGELGPDGALVLGPDAVLPVVAGHEVPPGPAQDGHVQLLHGPEHVLAKAPVVRERASLLVDAPVDHPPQVLGEVPEEKWAHLADGPVPIDLDPGLRGCGLG